jgi:EmrB/QacA subfamily drug resistance transporter
LHTRLGPGAALALLAGAQFVIVLDTSIVNMALPSIEADLALTERSLSWVVNAYTLTFGGFLLLGGRLGDLLGLRRAFVAGLALFGAASMAGGLATTTEMLVGARAVQGLGAATIAPAALGILTRLYEDGAPRNRALAIWGAVSAAGAPAGAVLGGALSDLFGWSSVLLVNVPICAAALVLAPRLVPWWPLAAQRCSFDLAGAASVTAGLGVVVYAVVDANRLGREWPTSALLLLVGVGLILVFVAVESRAAAPLMPLQVLRRHSLAAASAVALIGSLPVFGMAFCLTLYVQGTLGYSALEAGLAFLPFGLVAIASARVAATLVTRLGFKPLMVIGQGILVCGLLLMVTITDTTGYVDRVLPTLVLLGVGLGWFGVAVNVAALSGVLPGDAGLAAGVITTAQQLGGALGLALTVAVLEGAGGVSGDVTGLRAALALDAAMAAVGLILAVLVVSARRSREHARAARGLSGPQSSVRT